MTEPPAPPDAPSRTVVLIPIRSFDDAKSRLSRVLDRTARRRLAVWMAERVVGAAAPLPAQVVSDDDEVLRWAASVGAAAHRPGIAGLNASVTAAVEAAAGAGFERAIVAHADLPAAVGFAALDRSGVCIAPDARRDGSNVVSVPTGAGFVFRYGPGSFSAHCEEARRLGLPLTVIDDEDLAWDVDDPDDLPGEWRAITGREVR